MLYPLSYEGGETKSLYIDPFCYLVVIRDELSG